MKFSKQEFTPRQEQIIRLALMGISSREIAKELGMSQGTVNNHLYFIYRTFKVHSKEELFWKICEKYQWKKGKLARKPVLHSRFEIIQGNGKGQSSNINKLIKRIAEEYSIREAQLPRVFQVFTP